MVREPIDSVLLTRRCRMREVWNSSDTALQIVRHHFNIYTSKSKLCCLGGLYRRWFRLCLIWSLYWTVWFRF